MEYTEDFDKNTFEPVETPETQPEMVEPVVPETPTDLPPEVPENKISEKQEQDRYEYWQSVAYRQQQELDALKQPKAPPPQDELPVEPQIPPGYNDLDAYTDPNSASFAHRVANENYLKKLVLYTQKQTGQLAEERKLEKQRQEELSVFNTQKAHAIGKLAQAAKGDVQLAQKVFNFFADTSGWTPERYIQAYNAINQNPAPQAEKGEWGAPPPKSSGVGDRIPMTPDDAFNQQLTTQKKSYI